MGLLASSTGHAAVPGHARGRLRARLSFLSQISLLLFCFISHHQFKHSAYVLCSFLKDSIITHIYETTLDQEY